MMRRYERPVRVDDTFIPSPLLLLLHQRRPGVGDDMLLLRDGYAVVRVQVLLFYDIQQFYGFACVVVGW